MGRQINRYKKDKLIDRWVELDLERCKVNDM